VEPVDKALCAQAAAAGEVLAVSPAGIEVVCGQGTVLRVTTVQPASGRTMPAGASSGTIHFATQNVRSGCFSF